MIFSCRSICPLSATPVRRRSWTPPKEDEQQRLRHLPRGARKLVVASRGLQQWRRFETLLCEIFDAAQFSTFSTVSPAISGHEPSLRSLAAAAKTNEQGGAMA